MYDLAQQTGADDADPEPDEVEEDDRPAPASAAEAAGLYDTVADEPDPA
jgi:hypothetical protein